MPKSIQKFWFAKGLLILIVASFSYQPSQSEIKEISKSEMLNIVKNCNLEFSKGVKQKDSTILVNIYSDNAQYVHPTNQF